MKHLFMTMAMLFAAGLIYGQEKPLSPAKTASGEVDGVKIEVNYSAPSVRDREIWGGLVPYEKVWRTGANEATTIEFSQDVTINGQALAASKYALFTIPYPEKWVVVFNADPKQWGAYKYDESKDALRVSATPSKAEFAEQLQINVEGNGVQIHWEKLSVGFEVKAQ